MAACTSRAAALTSRSRSNCKVIDVVPNVLLDVISVTPAIRLRLRSSGVATADAMVSGLAPGRLAPTLIVGKSTCGSGDTGSWKYPIAPAKVTAIVNNVVATGLRIKGSERFIGTPHRNGFIRCPIPTQSLKPKIDYRGRIQCQQLTHQQSADDAYS